jgi:hypothetical protein
MSTTPRTWVVGEVVTAAELNTEIRDQMNEIFAAWSAYTPTWAGLSVLGSSVAHGRASKIGRTVKFIADLVWGTSGSLGTGTVTVSLPYTATSAPTGDLGWAGSGRHNPGNGTTWKDLRPSIEPGGTTATVYGIRQTDLGWVSPGTAGYVWATGAAMRVNCVYESAT